MNCLHQVLPELWVHQRNRLLLFEALHFGVGCYIATVKEEFKRICHWQIIGRDAFGNKAPPRVYFTLTTGVHNAVGERQP